jgi:23S rRNA (uracil1939-C5)-methyltransferase
MKEKIIGCRHFSLCSGCVYDSCVKPPEQYEEARKYFDNSWHIELPLIQGDVRHWRGRAKLAVRAPDRIGLFEKGSHNVLPIPHCQVHHPKINHAVERFLQAFRQAKLSAYDEKTKKGDLRYIQCLVERRTQKVHLSLVLNRTEANEAWYSFVKNLFEPTFWHSIWFNFNDKPTNTIFGRCWEKVVGQEEIWEEIAGLEVAFGPSHFGQANLAIYEKLVYEIEKNVMPDSRAVELYAGIGVIGLVLARKCSHVLLCEVESHAKSYFEKALAKLAPSHQARLCYKVAKAEECLNLLEGAAVCVVDPPRKGLGPDLMQRILQTPSLEQLIYVSCNWRSLERDLQALPANWTVAKATSYLFFPGTNQIETVAFLSKI